MYCLGSAGPEGFDQAGKVPSSRLYTRRSLQMGAHSLFSAIVMVPQGWVLLIPEKNLLMRIVAALLTSMLFTVVILAFR